MTELHFPFIESAILVPLIGALCVRRLSDAYLARRWSLWFTGVTFLLAALEWIDFSLLGAVEAEDRWLLTSCLFGRELFIVDRLSAPLLPLAALLYFLTTLVTLRTKIRRFSFGWSLVSESLILAAFSCKEPWLLIGLLAAGTVPPLLELRARGRPTFPYVLHLGAYVGLMVVGWGIIESEGVDKLHSLWGVAPLLLAVFIRSGIVPVHCWMTHLYEHASFGTALLFTMPLTGAYAAVRLLLPVANADVLRTIGLVSLVTAVYASGMALVQRDARRFFCYLLLSHSALVLVGLEIVTKLGLTGALCVWLSATLALGGFGLSLRALEARRGPLSLTHFQGLYEQTPVLAVFFFLMGLGAIGFPGTLGFVGSELLVDGAVGVYPLVGVAVVIASALNGIAFVKTYFALFTGTKHSSTVSLRIGGRERFAMLVLTALVVLGGFVPQPGVASRFEAAEELLERRSRREATAGDHRGIDEDHDGRDDEQSPPTEGHSPSTHPHSEPPVD